MGEKLCRKMLRKTHLEDLGLNVTVLLICVVISWTVKV